MDLMPHIAALQHQFLLSAAASGEEAQALAERLLLPLEAATRLTMLDALSEASEEITTELAPGSVDARLRGRDIEFVVVAPSDLGGGSAAADHSDVGPSAHAGPIEPAVAADSADTADATAVRTTLRIPESLKAQAELAAAAAGISLNTWLIRSIATALQPIPAPPRSESKPGRNHFSGWVS
ncbi:toxin-antitoxin system HicB family antitoxin [Leucobacter luti]|nr:toxin-antitoxin system HicB family antitoxin [Leucobacter luti]